MRLLRNSLIIVGFLLFIGGLSASFTHFYPPRTAAVTESRPDVAGLLHFTNIEREKLHVAPLVLDERLNTSAAGMCEGLVAADIWEHRLPDGRDAESFIDLQFGDDYQTWAENLSITNSTGSQVVNAWMNSPSHRAALLDSEYDIVGFAVCDSASYHNIVVQHFVGL